MEQNFLAFDLGATSGRTVLGSFAEDSLTLTEINRFPNHLIKVGEHFYWDIYELYRCVLDGITLAVREGIKPLSVGIDTWGVDFVCIGKDGGILRQPYSYRDPHTTGGPEHFFNRISRDTLYKKTGIQIMNFNSIFQLDAMRQAQDSALEAAEKILFMPDALGYMLTGEMVTEYTIASTSQLLDVHTRRFDKDLLAAVGLEESHFGRLILPGQRVGNLTASVCQMTGVDSIPLIAVGGHDTASAVAAVPALNQNFAYLSSGTWSLMGVETVEPVVNEATSNLNFTNEGGVEGTIRLLKNICGMWLLERCRERWADADYNGLINEAKSSEAFRSLINPDDARFVNPSDMEGAIVEYCRTTDQPLPESRGQVVRCIFESLALRYRQVLEGLCSLSPHPIEVLHVIGGGSRNELLNQFTANSIGMPVVAGPSEATAIGNVMMQAMAAGVATDVAGMRKLVHSATPLKTYHPEETDVWNRAYLRFKKLVTNS